MKKFLIKCILFSLPLWIALIPYVFRDPFKVLYHYENYYSAEGKDYYVNTNRGFVSTQMYIQNKDKYHYDSFIFGSSRSHVFCINEWKKYIGDTTSCFHFDGYGESLYMIHAKMKYVDGKSPMRNVLLPIDYEVLSQVEQDYGHLWVAHPALVEGNWGTFQMAHLRAYITPKFLFAYWDLFLTGMSKPYMFEDQIIEKADTVYNVAYNERSNRESVIERLDDEYYAEKNMSFPERNGENYYPIIIGSKQKLMLTEICAVLERNGGNFRVLINPGYDQKRLSEEDMAYLKELFGNNLVDFSGKNVWTEDFHYWSDPSHFNAYVSNEMLRVAYENDLTERKRMLDSIYFLRAE